MIIIRPGDPRFYRGRPFLCPATEKMRRLQSFRKCNLFYLHHCKSQDTLTISGRFNYNFHIYLNNKHLIPVRDGLYTPAISGQSHWLLRLTIRQVNNSVFGSLYITAGIGQRNRLRQYCSMTFFFPSVR